MSAFDIEMVGKVGSMALIRQEERDLDYNIFSRIGKALHPGMIWVSSGAVEIGRLDYLMRNGGNPIGDDASEDSKVDYAAQGQSILMQNYRNFISPSYSVRQILVEHQHFNDATKREHIKNMLIRCAKQNAIPIVNYNDAVSSEE
ncbi:MAG: uridylate kinase, partial [Clostridia bacterium]|nr:uridylate kinase [Clostridia bacterium]